MPLKPFVHSLSCFLLCFLVSCSTEETPIVKAPTPSLKQAYQDKFLIGAALNAAQITGADTSALNLVDREFNTVTPENVMKWENIHPAPDSFTFARADEYVARAEAADMFVIGHALVWHSQLSDYVAQETDPVKMQSYLAEHIKAVAGRYQGRVDGWDVLNEALNEDGSLRESVFYQVLGEDYIQQAFALANAADPSAELYYNDYNMWKPEKRAGAIQMIKKLQAAGIRIDGVGMQAHYSTLGPDLKDIENSIIAYADLGLKVMITELDVTALPNPWDLEGAEVSQNFAGSPFMDPFKTGLPDSMQTVMTQRYTDLFRLYQKHADKISRVTFWGVNDGQSWLNNWPIKGRTNYPLLFDRDFQPKAAYHQVMALPKEVTTAD